MRLCTDQIRNKAPVLILGVTEHGRHRFIDLLPCVSLFVNNRLFIRNNIMGLTKTEFFLPDENYLAEIFRILAHPCRIRIISTLLFNESRTVGDMTEQFNGLTQSTISEHIRQLKEADLITGKQVGNTIRYSLNGAIWGHYKWVLATVGNDAELMLLYR